ncbi:hypothetical protein ACFOYU_19950 [Microvirga sp. GCM10011540]|uniref:hypothetical protein n=1 Tax=Microvirga sp. GCM10011540 TaxID=3317338 RepID=UPI0036120A5B
MPGRAGMLPYLIMRENADKGSADGEGLYGSAPENVEKHRESGVSNCLSVPFEALDEHCAHSPYAGVPKLEYLSEFSETTARSGI